MGLKANKIKEKVVVLFVVYFGGLLGPSCHCYQCRVVLVRGESRDCVFQIKFFVIILKKDPPIHFANTGCSVKEERMHDCF